MTCPYCKEEMKEGSLITSGAYVGWGEKEEFKKKGLQRLAYNIKFRFGKLTMLASQTVVPSAFYCDKCDALIVQPVNAKKINEK